MQENELTAGGVSMTNDDQQSAPDARPGIPDVIDADEPILLPLVRLRIEVARFRSAVQVREVIESRLAQGCLVEEVIVSPNDVEPLKMKLTKAYKHLCATRPEQVTNFATAAGEILSNGIRDRQENGRPFTPERYREARVTFGIEPQDDRWSDFLVRVKDSGAGFNPYKVLNPANPENIELPNGRGMLMVSHSMMLSKDAVGGRVMYLPVADMDDEVVLCNDVVLRIPVYGPPSELVKQFRIWHDRYPYNASDVS